jgi:glucan phosphoethanolaminetransferase (alkaline phosphatase superfamily)
MLNDPPPPPYRPDMADDTTAEPRRLRSLYVAIGLTSTPRVVVVAFVVIPTANPAAVSSSLFIRTARIVVVVVILGARILPHPARPSFRRTVVVVVVIFVVVAIIIILVARVCFSRNQSIKSTSTTYPSSQKSEDFKSSSQKKTHKHVKRHPNGIEWNDV